MGGFWVCSWPNEYFLQRKWKVKKIWYETPWVGKGLVGVSEDWGWNGLICVDGGWYGLVFVYDLKNIFFKGSKKFLLWNPMGWYGVEWFGMGWLGLGFVHDLKNIFCKGSEKGLYWLVLVGIGWYGLVWFGIGWWRLVHLHTCHPPPPHTHKYIIHRF